MPIAISAEQRALQASIREWAARAGTLALVRGLEPGATADPPGSPAGGSGSQAGRPAGSVGAPGTPAHRSGPAGARAGVAHEKPPWAEPWSALTSLGIFSIALPEAAGGDGGTVADLPAAKELLPALATEAWPVARAGSSSLAAGRSA